MPDSTDTMRLSCLSLTVLLSTLLLAGCTGAASSSRAISTVGGSIEYKVQVTDPASEEFDVSATLHNVVEDTLTFNFPIWAPGAYGIDNYGAFVHDFVATLPDGRRLATIRRDTNTFLIFGAGPETRIAYKVHDIESTGDALWFELSDIEADMAYANGTALFGYPQGFKEIPYTVSFKPPSGWNVAIALDSVSGRPWTYVAHDYDELVDAPVQMGIFERHELRIGGKAHIITLASPSPIADSTVTQILDGTRSVVETVSGFFGDMPYDRYLFQHFFFDPSDQKYGEYSGALEHASSSTYLTPQYSWMSVKRILLPVIAHEYWHLWSPKRFHVPQLGPFNYQDTPRTKSLWFAEGLTEYYANLLLRRNGTIDPGSALKEFEEGVNELYGRPQRRSLTDVSLEFSTLDPSISGAVYSRGPIIGTLLDAAIRSQTGNRKSLDDAMRWFNEKYGKTGATFTDEEIIPIIERATGAKLEEMYRRWIDGHEPLPFEQYLPAMGLKRVAEVEVRPNLGAVYESIPGGGMLVKSVVPGGSADSLGLRAGDTLTRIQTMRRGDSASVVVDVKGEKKPRGGRLIPTPMNVYYLRVDPDAGELERNIRRDLFGL